jgi:transcription elongation factor GreA
MTDQIITPEGYEKLRQELEMRSTVKRREIAERIQSAKDLGDLSENAEYAEAKDEHAFNEGRIAELTQLIKNLTIVETKNGLDTVSMGSLVTAQTNGSQKQFKIVSFNEADPMNGKISNESPIGLALLGKKVGDNITVKTPRGEMRYEIISIE